MNPAPEALDSDDVHNPLAHPFVIAADARVIAYDMAAKCILAAASFILWKTTVSARAPFVAIALFPWCGLTATTCRTSKWRGA